MPWALAVLNLRVRLKNIPVWMLEESDAGLRADEGYRRWLAMIEIGRTLDSEPVDVALARGQIDRFASEYAPDGWLRSCDAFLAAVHERDLARARRVVDQLTDPTETPQMQAAARAAVAKLAGDETGAGVWLDRMDSIVAGNSPFLDRTFAEIRARIEGLVPLVEVHAETLQGSPARA